tara:strand:+ start:313 stop:858 length:546 start_codon:yes stop_codon:yes gene_type:complete
MGILTLTPAVFLDRDGIINKALVRNGKPFSPSDLEEFEWVPGIVAVTEVLVANGFKLVCVTNQPDVGRGLQNLSKVKLLHKLIKDELPIEEIYVCYHDGLKECDCRKPKPGMILQAAKDHSIDLNRSWVVGDRWKDIDAGNAAGCNTIFVDYSYDEKLRSSPNDIILDIREIPDIVLERRT